MSQTNYEVTLTFTEPLLGTVPKNRNVYAKYIQSKKEDAADETATVPEIDEQAGWTGFHEEDGKPFIFDYQIKGYLKDCCSMLSRDKESQSSKLKAFKKVIDGMIFPAPRRIFLQLPKGGKVEVLERSLRAQTPQGERITLVRSDAAPVGTVLALRLLVLGDLKPSLLREWFSYGALRGLGQWRNGGYGRFEFTLDER